MTSTPPVQKKKPAVPVLGHPVRNNVSVQLAPGQRCVALPPESHQVLIYDLIPHGDLYKPVARIHDRYTLVGEKTIKRMGLGIEYKALRNLIAGGFVEGVQLQPRRWAVSLRSFFQHVERCKADPEFWSKPENIKRYREARLMV